MACLVSLADARRKANLLLRPSIFSIPRSGRVFITDSCFGPKDARPHHKYNEFTSRAVLLVLEIPNTVHSYL